MLPPDHCGRGAHSRTLPKPALLRFESPMLMISPRNVLQVLPLLKSRLGAIGGMLWVLSCGVSCGGAKMSDSNSGWSGGAAGESQSGEGGAPTNAGVCGQTDPRSQCAGGAGGASAGSAAGGASGSSGTAGTSANGASGWAGRADAAAVACTGASPSLAADVVPIFAKNCARTSLCHGDFSDASQAYLELVNVPASRNTCGPKVLVTPSDLAKSYLVNKLTGVGICPQTQRMPLDSSLIPADVQTIADWICSGAKDN